MKCLLPAVVGCMVLTGTVRAQSAPHWSQNHMPTTQEWQDWWARKLDTNGDGANLKWGNRTLPDLLANKVDAAGGSSTSQTLTTPTVNLGLTINGNGGLPFIPKGSPVAGTVGSVVRYITMAHGGVQNFGDNTECTSMSVAPSVGGNICQYDWMELAPRSGGGWAGNDVIQMDGGFARSRYTAIGREIDINNIAGDYGEFAAANSVGILLNGLKYLNTAAVSVQTGNSRTGMTGTNGMLPIWYYGYHVGPDAVSEADFDTQSGARYGWRARGHHDVGIWLANDNTAVAAIMLGDQGARQGIMGRHGAVESAILYMDQDGMPHIGSQAGGRVASDASIIPGTDAAYALGSATRRWTNVNTAQVNGVPAVATGAPTIGAGCTPGAQKYDSRKLYMCLTDSKWHTMAMATD